MVMRGVEVLPLISGLWFLFTFIITYILAMALKFLHSFWPYISELGTHPPVSCLFGQLLNIGALLMAIVIYIRYIHIRQVLLTLPQPSRCCNQNITCLILGVTSSLGVTLVGNFQLDEVLSVHILGALMSFGGASIYQVMMWRLSKNILTQKPSTIDHIRCMLSIVSLACWILTWGVAYAVMKAFKAHNEYWVKGCFGYEYFIGSPILQWIGATTTSFYIMTFYKEFKKLNFYPPTVELL